MVKFLKTKFRRCNVKKFIFIWDLYLSKAERHYLASFRGKEDCDGVGGSLKRLAYRAVLQNKPNSNDKQLFEWACSNFTDIEFVCVLLKEFQKYNENMKHLLSKAKAAVGTRQYHCYKPVDTKSLNCKSFSKYSEAGVVKVC